MRTVLICALCAGLGTGGLAGLSPQQTGQSPVFRAGTDVVSIDVSVRRKNMPVVGLGADAFDLFDNGVPQQCEVQTVESIPVDVSLVFDENAEPWITRQFRSDLAKIAALMRPIDRLRVITFATDVLEVLPMQGTSGWGAEGLPDLGPSQAALKLPRPGRQDQNDLDRRHDPKLRWSSILDALLLAIARPPELGRRHLVIAFASGINPGSVLTDGRLFEAVAARTDALIHVALSILRLTPEWRHLEYYDAVVAAAAVSTGGEMHQANDGVSAFKSIFADFRQSYVLSYTLRGVPPGGWHTVVVRTPGHAEYTIRARSGYMGR